MAQSHPRQEPMYGYKAYPLTAATTGDGATVAPLFETSTATVIAVGSQAITLAVWSDELDVGRVLVIWGSGTPEQVAITAINKNAKTVTATFANTHAGPTTVTLTCGTHMFGFFVGAAGTTMTLELWDGEPSISSPTPQRKTSFAIGAQQGWFPFPCIFPQGLWVKYTGSSAGNITVMASPDPK